MAIHNVYNPQTDRSPPNTGFQGLPGNSAILTLNQALHIYRGYEQMAMGDFNLQHRTVPDKQTGPARTVTRPTLGAHSYKQASHNACQ